jgi:hypothetical protein
LCFGTNVCRTSFKSPYSHIEVEFLSRHNLALLSIELG